ncbi:hypothetical protein [Paracoccus sp. SCSIO 75233]|uniref:hypothetical protein n=1 Tax=Paracoccus sp. SCSIO 75233 TaxID=3017782 RepID=UPI0022F09DF1|nr:hypothetical protein [Paracoccus sp. SCSIO 75233]WBU52320.1 hypothetical protein PAF12_10805 [Paracoccus sp. SCSIO 75233]
MRTSIIAASLLAIALPAFAQDATEELPPGGEAPVDGIAPISDAAPDANGVPDASSVQLTCTFATECIDDECADSGYTGTLTVISDGAGMAEAEWSDPTETVAMAAVNNGSTTLASATETSPAKQRLLTLLETGEARFTTHLTDPIMSITYAGQCE